MHLLRSFGVAFVATVVAAVLVAGAGANTHRANQVDLSTKSGVDTYLRSLGLNPARFVIQRGAFNYSGARCPGKKWTCTTSRRVLQLSTATAGSNSATCTPQDSTTSLGNPAAYSCVIVQVSTGGGTNTGTCNLTTDDSAGAFPSTPPAITQSCSINQKIDPAAKKTGKNIANVTQSISQSSARSCGLIGSDQQCVDTQKAVIMQSNTSGPNTASVSQAVNQSLSTSAASVSQAQASKMAVDIRQNYPDAPATGDPGNCSTIQGSASATVTQRVTQSENAGTATSGLQYQNSDISGTVNQCSNSKSTFTVAQNENQTQLPNTAVPGIMRTQIGPGGIYCCSFQGTNPGDSCTISPTTNQQSPGAVQIEAIESRVASFGSCGGTVSETQNGVTRTSSLGGATFDNGFACLGAATSCLNAGLATIPTSFPTTGVNPKSPETTADYGDAVALTASLQRNDTSGSLAGVPVILDVDGQASESCATLTSASGVASCDVTLSDTPASHVVNAAFAGAGPFQSSTGSSSFTVNRETTSLAIDPSGTTSLVKERQTGYVTLNVKLTEDGSNAVGGKQILFSASGNAVTCLSPTTGITGSGGVASCRFNPPPGNTVSVSASFPDTDAYYAGSSMGPLTLGVVSHT